MVMYAHQHCKPVEMGTGSTAFSQHSDKHALIGNQYWAMGVFAACFCCLYVLHVHVLTLGKSCVACT
jgi:hypothetical protein